MGAPQLFILTVAQVQIRPCMDGLGASAHFLGMGGNGRDKVCLLNYFRCRGSPMVCEGHWGKIFKNQDRLSQGWCSSGRNISLFLSRHVGSKPWAMRTEDQINATFLYCTKDKGSWGNTPNPN